MHQELCFCNLLLDSLTLVKLGISRFYPYPNVYYFNGVDESKPQCQWCNPEKCRLMIYKNPRKTRIITTIKLYLLLDIFMEFTLLYNSFCCFLKTLNLSTSFNHSLNSKIHFISQKDKNWLCQKWRTILLWWNIWSNIRFDPYRNRYEYYCLKNFWMKIALEWKFW